MKKKIRRIVVLAGGPEVLLTCEAVRVTISIFRKADEQILGLISGNTPLE